MDKQSLKVAPQVVDLNDLTLEDDQMGADFDPNADAFGGVAPPPDDTEYVVKLELDKGRSNTGFISGKDKNGNSYVMAYITGTITEGPFEGRKFFDNVSTTVMQSTGACSMASLLDKALGVSVSPQIGKRELAILLRDTLEEGAFCIVETQWRASQQRADGTYRSVKHKMRNFPKKKDGSYDHVVISDGERCFARGEITDYKPLES